MMTSSPGPTVAARALCSECLAPLEMTSVPAYKRCRRSSGRNWRPRCAVRGCRRRACSAYGPSAWRGRRRADVFRRGEVGFAETEVENGDAFGLHLLGLGTGGERRGRLHGGGHFRDGYHVDGPFGFARFGNPHRYCCGVNSGKPESGREKFVALYRIAARCGSADRGGNMRVAHFVQRNPRRWAARRIISPA